MLLQPVDTEDDRMLKLRDVKRDHLVVRGNRERDRGKVGDGASETGSSISHIEANGVVERRDREAMSRDGGGIDEGLLGTGVDECEQGDRRRVG